MLRHNPPDTGPLLDVSFDRPVLIPSAAVLLPDMKGAMDTAAHGRSTDTMLNLRETVLSLEAKAAALIHRQLNASALVQPDVQHAALVEEAARKRREKEEQQKLEAARSVADPTSTTYTRLQRITDDCLDNFFALVPLAAGEKRPEDQNLTEMVELRRQNAALHPLDEVTLASNVPEEIANTITTTSKGVSVMLQHEQPLLRHAAHIAPLRDLDYVITNRYTLLSNPKLPSDRAERIAWLRQRQKEAEDHFHLHRVAVRDPAPVLADDAIDKMKEEEKALFAFAAKVTAQNKGGLQMLAAAQLVRRGRAAREAVRNSPIHALLNMSPKTPRSPRR